ncbi:MAG: 50S ribosomal protein L29 [Parcubacteria group bacterium]
MKYIDLQRKSMDELQTILKDTRVQLGHLQFELANKALKDTSKLRKAKMDIAQIMTALNRKVTEQMTETKEA